MSRISGSVTTAALAAALSAMVAADAAPVTRKNETVGGLKVTCAIGD